MPRFKVYGADRQSGKDVSLTIDAETVEGAEAAASVRKILVRRLVELEESTSALIASQATNRRSRPVPRYGVLHALALLVGVVGALSAFIGFFLFLDAVVLDGGESAWANAVVPIAIIWSGLLTLLLGEAAQAFRDLCINSWHARHRDEQSPT
jgi:hypothetical protein